MSESHSYDASADQALVAAVHASALAAQLGAGAHGDGDVEGGDIVVNEELHADEPQAADLTTRTGQSAASYTLRVRERFVDQPEVWQQFASALDLLKAKILPGNPFDILSSLLQGETDLIAELAEFLPESAAKAQPAESMPTAPMPQSTDQPPQPEPTVQPAEKPKKPGRKRKAVKSAEQSSPEGTAEQSSLACEACRQSRAKCTRELPHCTRCVKRKVDCVYLPTKRTRTADPPTPSSSAVTRTESAWSVATSHMSPQMPIAHPLGLQAGEVFQAGAAPYVDPTTAAYAAYFASLRPPIPTGVVMSLGELRVGMTLANERDIGSLIYKFVTQNVTGNREKLDYRIAQVGPNIQVECARLCVADQKYADSFSDDPRRWRIVFSPLYQTKTWYLSLIEQILATGGIEIDPALLGHDVSVAPLARRIRKPSDPPK